MIWLMFLQLLFMENPAHVRISWTEHDTATTMTVSWDTKNSDEDSYVQYGTTKQYGKTEKGSSFQAKNPLGFIHRVKLSGLKPDTLYHYRAGNGSDWGDDHTFTTAPDNECEPFTFVMLGDNRGDTAWGPSPRWKSILNEAASEKPAFILNSGDIVFEGKDAKQWDQYLADTDPVQADIPIMSTIGNHDDDVVSGKDANYNQVFALPVNSVSKTEDFYYFIYGNTIIVSLSTQTFPDGDYPYEKQAKWLDKVLTEHPMTWKIVFFHHPIYTSSYDIFGWDVNHKSNEKNQNPAFIPIFDKHHVDFVFYGHNHFYERFAPMVQGKSWTEGKVVNNYSKGTVYVVSGGAGALTYSVAMMFICGKATGSTKCSGDHHFIKVTINKNKLFYAAHKTKAQILGTSDSNAKDFDFLSIKKNIPVNCDSSGADIDNSETDTVEQITDVSDMTDQVNDLSIPEITGVETNKDKFESKINETTEANKPINEAGLNENKQNEYETNKKPNIGPDDKTKIDDKTKTDDKTKEEISGSENNSTPSTENCSCDFSKKAASPINSPIIFTFILFVLFLGHKLKSLN